MEVLHGNGGRSTNVLDLYFGVSNSNNKSNSSDDLPSFTQFLQRNAGIGHKRNIMLCAW